MRVLVVEDDISLGSVLQRGLVEDGHAVDLERTLAGARRAVQISPYHLVVLDLGLPDGDGLSLCRELHATADPPRVLVLTARDATGDKVLGLDAGADDYLTKPFSTGELFARLRVALRHAERVGKEPPSMITIGELRLDPARRQVFARGTEIHLTPIEYKLFSLLMRHAGKVITHRQLLKDVWGPSYVDQMQYVRVYMGQLRHKLEVDPARPRYLVTEPGVGYRLRLEN